MNRYWDLSEKERAALTQEQVDHYIDVDLMEKGVVKPLEPKYLDETAPTVRTIKKFVLKLGYSSVDGIAFETADDAQNAIAYCLGVSTDYFAGQSWKYISSDPISIEQTELYYKHEVNDARKEFERASRNKAENDKIRKEYQSALDAISNASEDLIDDWHKCQQLEYRYSQIMDLRKRYIEMSDGNVEIVEKFLAKAYLDDEIEKAKAWFEQGD